MKDAVKATKCENVANFTSGFEYAFEILHRVIRHFYAFPSLHEHFENNQFYIPFNVFQCSIINRARVASATRPSCSLRMEQLTHIPRYANKRTFSTKSSPKFRVIVIFSFSQHQIIKRYNWPHRPVRIFTYLIGGASGSRESMHSMACSNKGKVLFMFSNRLLASS